MSARVSIRRRMLLIWRNGVKPLYRKYEIPLFIAIVIVTFIMGVVGFGRYFESQNDPRPLLDWMFLTVIMFRGIVLQAGPLPLELEIARWVAMFIVLYAILRTLMSLFFEQANSLVLRWLTSGHVVICGLSDKGSALASELYRQGYGVVVIDPKMSREMAAKCKEDGAIVLSGDPSDRDILRRARADRAKYLVAALDDDGVNAGVAMAARELVLMSKSDMPPTCYVHIVDRALCNLLKADYEFNRNRSDGLRLEFFNTYDAGAKALLKEFPAYEGNSARIAVLGSGRLSDSLIIQAATDGLFYGHGRRLSIILLDPGATKKSAVLQSRYPILGSTCNMTAVDGDPLLADASMLKGASTVYVCMEKDGDCLSAALSLKKILNDGTRVVACLGRTSGLSKLIDRIGTEQGLEGLSFFSVLDATSKPEVLLGGTREVLAMAIHEDYLRSQVKAGIRPESNPSVASWDGLPEGLKESNRHNADHILVKLAAAGYGIELLTDAGAPGFKFTKEEIEKMSIIEHERWVNERLQQGWTFAPGPKDLDKRTSPYILPWEELSEEIREYDRNVIRALPMALARAGFQMRKINEARLLAASKIISG
jgi:voltage-gated potassium channel Kch